MTEDQGSGRERVERGSAEEYARAVEAIDRPEDRPDGADPRLPPRASGQGNRGILLGVVVVAFIGVLVWNAYTVWRPPGPLAPEVAENAAKVSVFVAASQVESFREVNGRLPDTLEEVGLEAEGLDYRRVGDGYELDGEVHGQGVRFTSTDDPEALLRSLPIPLDGMEAPR